MKTELSVSDADLSDSADSLERFLNVSSSVVYKGYFQPSRGDFHIRCLSTNFVAVTGCKIDQAQLCSSWMEFVHPDDRDRVILSFQRLYQRTELRCDYRFRVAKNQYRWFSDTRRVVERDLDGGVHVEGSLIDVTERRFIQDRLHEREQLLRQLVETETDCVAVVSADVRIDEINPAGVALLEHLDAGAVIGAHLARFIAPEDRARVTVLTRRVFSGEPVQISLKILTRGGEVRRVEIRMAPLFTPQGRIQSAVLVARDVSQRDQVENQAHYLAHYDMLTGLPNRVLYRDRLLQSMAQAKRAETLLAVMFLDIDHFKDINDTLGHSVGDCLLKELSARISSCTRESDTVARFGGDEFGVIQTNLHRVEDAIELAERIVEVINQPLPIEGHQIHPGVSIGVTIYPFEDHEADELLKNADMAMYKAKREGRNRYQFYVAELNHLVQRRAAIERDLRLALQRNEFSLHYQPQLDLRSGQIVGVEALLRWNQQERGAVSPAEFIPVAESTGMIMEIGRWVLREACRQARAWQDEGLTPVRVAINLSAVQFRDKNLISSINQNLEETGLDPRYIEVELTESLIMKDVEATIATLSHLRDLGIQISIDDFGTGYSSLSYLTRFPVQKIKLDQSFVRDSNKKDGAAICRTIIALGQSLDMRVMAEGVEYEEQMRFLRQYGCDEVQGYYFSRPLPGTAIRRLLSEAGEELRQRVLQAAE